MLPRTYEEFLERLAADFKLTLLGAFEERSRWDTKVDWNKTDSRLVRTWTTGGMTGGSCWGTELYARESEPEPDDTFLEEILQHYVPDLTFLEFRVLERSNVYDKYDAGYSEYYGNNVEADGRLLSIKRLYEVLSEIYDKREAR